MISAGCGADHVWEWGGLSQRLSGWITNISTAALSYLIPIVAGQKSSDILLLVPMVPGLLWCWLQVRGFACASWLQGREVLISYPCLHCHLRLLVLLVAGQVNDGFTLLAPTVVA